MSHQWNPELFQLLAQLIVEQLILTVRHEAAEGYCMSARNISDLIVLDLARGHGSTGENTRFTTKATYPRFWLVQPL